MAKKRKHHSDLQMKVKLAKKVKLLDPHGLPMKMDVEYNVPKNQFWLKRLKVDKDIVLSGKSAKMSDKEKPKKKSGGK